MNDCIAVIGAGRWGSNLVSGLAEIGFPVVVVEPSAPARARALDLGALAAVRSWPDLDRHHRPQGVIVATPTLTHSRTVREVLDLGVPIYVEKPLTADPGDARRLLDECGDRLFALEKWRYHEAIEALRVLVEDGRLGSVRTLRTERTSGQVSPQDIDPVWLLAPHDLSIVRHILGDLPAPDTATGEWNEAGEMVGLSATFAPMPRPDDLESTPIVSIDVSGARPAFRRSIRIVGSKTSASFDLDAPTAVDLVDRSGVAEKIPLPGTLPTITQLRAVVGHLHGGPPPFSTGAEGVQSVETIWALRDLAERSRTR